MLFLEPIVGKLRSKKLMGIEKHLLAFGNHVMDQNSKAITSLELWLDSLFSRLELKNISTCKF
jgi:hypothetical protein